MRAKQMEFEVTYIDLTDKPDWFLAISPHGKVPVLVVDERPLFESNAIAEYLEETIAPPLHPRDPIARARNRAWTDYVSDFSDALGRVYNAKSTEDLEAALADVRAPMSKLERALETERAGDGPFFNGPDLSLVDAAYAPFLQRFGLCETVLRTGLFDDFPLVARWAEALSGSAAVQGSTADGFEAKFAANLAKRGILAGAMLSPS